MQHLYMNINLPVRYFTVASDASARTARRQILANENTSLFWKHIFLYYWFWSGFDLFIWRVRSPWPI